MISPLDFYLTELANPLTEFLDDIPRGEHLLEAMRVDLRPHPDDAVRQLPVVKRLRANAQLSKFHLPLGRDVEVAEMILELLETSLSQKRPSAQSVSEREAKAADFAKRVLSGKAPECEAVGRCLFGSAALGKTRTVREVLKIIPQVRANDPTKHPLLLPKTVNYVRVETPSNRTLAALTSRVITALGDAVGEDFSSCARGNISERLEALATLVMSLNLGVLIIDELQHILRKTLQPDLELTNFLVELSNCLGVPLLLVGTPQAKFATGGALRVARRCLGPLWEPWARDSVQWSQFSERLLGYQFTRVVARNEDIEPTLFDLSQGLPGIAVPLFQFAQRNALLIENDSNVPAAVSDVILRAAFERYMWSVKPMLDALRSKDPKKIAAFTDIMVDEKLVQEYLLAEHAREHTRRQKDIMKLRMAAHGSPK